MVSVYETLAGTESGLLPSGTKQDSLLNEKEAEARRVYAGLDDELRIDALNLFLLEFGDQGPAILPDVAEYILMPAGQMQS